jgi:hypothetical protein
LDRLAEKGGFMMSEVYWYLALIELNLGKYENCRNYLILVNQEDPEAHKNEIRKIRREIRFR